ncbi:MAG: hypothetical protein ACRD3D_12600 [Terriglobia bacterium]
MRSKFGLAGVLMPLLLAPALPCFAGEPLPDVSTLLRQVERNQERLEQEREKYSFSDIEEQDDLSRDDKVKRKTVHEYDVFFLHGYLVRRLVEKDGKALSASAQKKEDARVRKLVEKYERKAEKKSRPDDDGVGIAAFLRASRFTHPRWTGLAGRLVLEFDFEPNPNYRPKTFVERVVHTLSGEMWADAQAGEVVRLQARFDRSFRIDGGLLASLEKGTSVIAEQMLVGGSVWMPSYTSIHASGRLFLIKSERLNVTDRYSDYRIFHVESLSKIAPPAKP